MRRIYFLFSLIFCCWQVTNAQTQQGIVKTRGRMVNGQLVSGQRLTGATVTLSFGNPLVSGNNGAFSFNVPSGKNYSLVAAKKQGYTLADPEYTRRSFAYSGSNPFYVVLEDENQRQADINAATKNVRRTLNAQLQTREDEIESLKEQNKLSEEEYQNRLQELYDNQSKSGQLVKEMAYGMGLVHELRVDEDEISRAWMAFTNDYNKAATQERKQNLKDDFLQLMDDYDASMEEYEKLASKEAAIMEELLDNLNRDVYVQSNDLYDLEERIDELDGMAEQMLEEF